MPDAFGGAYLVIGLNIELNLLAREGANSVEGVMLGQGEQLRREGEGSILDQHFEEEKVDNGLLSLGAQEGF